MNNMDDYLKQKADPERRKKLLEERQDRMLADLRKREQTPIIKDSSLSTDDFKKVKSAAEEIDTKNAQKLLSGNEFASKIAALRGLGKKAASVLPFIGTAAGLASGNPAQAAEEAAGDLIPGLEAVKSESAGMSPEDEKQLLIEDRARKDYGRSPAKLDRLKNLIGNRSPASEIQKPLEMVGLSSNQLPHEDAEGLSAEEILPALQKQVGGKLQEAQEMSPEEMRHRKIQQLFNLRK